MSLLHDPVLCARCFRVLQPGLGELYEVTIRAVSDPGPPRLNSHVPVEELRAKVLSTLRQLEATSRQEAMDQVVRCLSLHLCISCYNEWIENPVGSQRS